jgi:hypothetical protein
MHAPAAYVTPSRSAPTRLLVRWWENYNNPRVRVGARYACGVFNAGLGVLLLSYGYWLGAVPLAWAALIFWTVYRLTLR